MARDVRTIDKIDQIRAEFFDRLIEEGKQREQEQKRQQAICLHNYTVEGPIIREWQMRTCERCGHEAIKRITTWQRGDGKCAIS